MFETRAIHYRDQGQGRPPWDSGGSSQDGGRQPIWEDPDEHFEGGLYPDAGPTQDDVVRPEGDGKAFIPPEEREDPPIEDMFENAIPMPESPHPNAVPKREEWPEESLPVEERASEAEKIYANLLEKTDFDRDFIEEMLEFEPDEQSEMRIDELRRRRKEMEDLASTGMMPMGPQPPQGPGIDMIMV